MAQYIGLDFETFSGVDITKVGLDNYINHPDFTPLLGAIAWRVSPTSEISTHLYDFVRLRWTFSGFPEDLMEFLHALSQTIVIALNGYIFVHDIAQLMMQLMCILRAIHVADLVKFGYALFAGCFQLCFRKC